jgi:N-formylglutamate amidohydrolase
MLSEKLQNLVKSFDCEILFDCHSLQTKISRSEARGAIEKLDSDEKQAIREHLKTRPPATSYEKLREDLAVAWNEVLS